MIMNTICRAQQGHVVDVPSEIGEEAVFCGAVPLPGPAGRQGLRVKWFLFIFLALAVREWAK